MNLHSPEFYERVVASALGVALYLTSGRAVVFLASVLSRLFTRVYRRIRLGHWVPEHLVRLGALWDIAPVKGDTEKTFRERTVGIVNPKTRAGLPFDERAV